MIDYFNEIDTSILVFLNRFHSNFWDNFMSIATSKNVWIPFYITVLLYIIKRYKWLSILTIIFLALVITLTDQIASSVCKPFFERLRPSHEPFLEGVVNIVKGRKGGLYGFISSHAANSFGFALFSMCLLKNKTYSLIIIIWAIFNSYTRIYLGIHYPGDIIGGTLVGILIGWGMFKLYIITKNSRFFLNRLFLRNIQKINDIDIRNVYSVLILTVVILLFVSNEIG